MENPNDTFTKANHYFISTINQMEIKITELKAHLTVKDTEIGHLSDKLNSIENES